MLEPVVLLPHRLPNVFVAPLPGVDDVGVGDHGGVLLHADPIVELDQSFSLDLFL